jgi:pimeloyl-ACP methyl ester carboxylesterase
MQKTMTTKILLAIDRTIPLDVNGSRQTIRVCAARESLPPLLVVQGGPALPLLHEVPKFQRLLNLEQDFLVGYWDQRGCGNAPWKDANSVSWRQQIDDVRTVLTWFHSETKQGVTMLGISIGGTMALRAAEHEPSRVKAIVAISPDSHTASSDAASYDFLQEQARRGGSRRLRRRVAKLNPPPYLAPAAFQRRTGLLADLGTIEHGRTFGALLRETLVGMIDAYGIVGTVTALRNMNLVLRRLLPDIVSLDLFANPPRIAIPVHYVFGEQDALNPPSIADRLPAAIAAPASTAVRVPDAGHMVHFDRPDVVRSVLVRA